VVQAPNNLVEYLVQAITEGMDANGDVTIRIEVPDSRGYKETAQGRQRRRLFSGRGVDTDIIVASAKAYMQALNKLIDAPSVRITGPLAIWAMISACRSRRSEIGATSTTAFILLFSVTLCLRLDARCV
jgi:hypothetical protein